MKNLNLTLIIVLMTAFASIGQNYKLKSPDANLQLEISVDKDISIKALLHGKVVANMDELSLDIKNEKPEKLKVRKVDYFSINQTIVNPVPIKNRKIKDHYNACVLRFKNQKIHIRAYNDGFAWSFETMYGKRLIEIAHENIEINLPDNSSIYHVGIDGFESHYEASFNHIPMDSIPKDKNAYLPLLFQVNEGTNLLFTETSVLDYPNLFLKKSDKGLESTFPGVPVDITDKGDRKEIINKRADYIAQTGGSRMLPWRICIVAEKDTELASTELPYILAREGVKNQNNDWIKPGQVAWDWWNANNITGVDFKSGINTDTYKYYIDFASQFGLEYIILDEGWSPTTKITEQVKDIDIAELIEYGKEKNVGVILWVLWKPLIQDLENILDTYQKWGAKGIKVDFMQRADQAMVNYYEDIARESFKRELLVDFHGSYKPAGLRRMYPNVLTYEGVRGLENVKWSKSMTAEHNCVLPFTRMVAGPMDYTPGAMINAHENHYSIRWNRPMSMTTRAHQVALYTIYESPLQMLCDTPSNYLKEKESTSFISTIPVIWDETKVLDAKVGEYIILARRYKSVWYIAGITKEAMEYDLSLDFLFAGDYEFEAFIDGVNADRHAEDYQTLKGDINSGNTLKVKMEKDGGFTYKLKAKHLLR
jgi:alpha-glucosidase